MCKWTKGCFSQIWQNGGCYNVSSTAVAVTIETGCWADTNCRWWNRVKPENFQCHLHKLKQLCRVGGGGLWLYWRGLMMLIPVPVMSTHMQVASYWHNSVPQIHACLTYFLFIEVKFVKLKMVAIKQHWRDSPLFEAQGQVICYETVSFMTQTISVLRGSHISGTMMCVCRQDQPQKMC